MLTSCAAIEPCDVRGRQIDHKRVLGIQYIPLHASGNTGKRICRQGAVEGLSIGYRTRDYEIDRDKGVRKLIKLDLREVSVVTFPMLELAGVTLVKSDGSIPTEREFEQYLARDAGISDDCGLAQALRDATLAMRG
ncbi:MAG: HK97 family phage prohead protease [Rhodobacteraceae bacterium]|nr:HK97 family phage prohead protease [Paracoccaceae bacterium]